MAGTLYVVPTPIGNLQDITLRALDVLKAVALVAAEDTRSAAHLLGHFAISKPLISYFDGNEASRSEVLLDKLRAGQDIALISEAGMPGVSDPGQRVIAAAVAAALPVIVLPGACASVTALVGSGLPTDRFSFIGFPPRAEGERHALFGSLRTREDTLIFYEAPARTATTLADMAAAFGDERPAVVARELSKVYEEYRRGAVAELAAYYRAGAPRGEVTIIVGGAIAEAALTDEQIEAEIRERVARGESAKEISTALALKTGKPRRALYQLALALTR